MLLAGSPGNGKTTLAEALADAMGVALFVVRYEVVIGSYLGETAQRIAKVFEHARSRQCVLLFDEFDAVGKERGDAHETGEIKRVVSSLLLQIDALLSWLPSLCSGAALGFQNRRPLVAVVWAASLGPSAGGRPGASLPMAGDDSCA